MTFDLYNYSKHMMNPRFDIIDHITNKKTNTSKKSLYKILTRFF